MHVFPESLSGRKQTTAASIPCLPLKPIGDACSASAPNGYSEKLLAGGQCPVPTVPPWPLQTVEHGSGHGEGAYGVGTECTGDGRAATTQWWQQVGQMAATMRKRQSWRGGERRGASMTRGRCRGASRARAQTSGSTTWLSRWRRERPRGWGRRLRWRREHPRGRWRGTVRRFSAIDLV